MLFIRNVTFMTPDPGRLADFWSAALGLGERRDGPDEVLLADADWNHPRLTFQRIAAGSDRPRQLHLDLTADDRLAEIARLEGLGAVRRGDVSEDEGWTWTVMVDPEGNEFCVTDP